MQAFLDSSIWTLPLELNKPVHSIVPKPDRLDVPESVAPWPIGGKRVVGGILLDTSSLKVSFMNSRRAGGFGLGMLSPVRHMSLPAA